MDFNELLNNKLFWVFAILLVLAGGIVFMNTVVVDKVTDRVIERLQKDYSPGPYAPGFDPDKVNPNFWRNQQQNQWPPQQQLPPERFRTGTSTWEDDWEHQRLVQPQ